MAVPHADLSSAASLPARSSLSAALLTDEDMLVPELIEAAAFSTEERQKIAALATELVEAAREGRQAQGGIDSFLAEYGLSSDEGVLLLCLAEALLRIPDSATADRLIAGTIGSGDWARHLGHSDSVLVNASTWGLMLTGHLLDWAQDPATDLSAHVQRLVARSGEPVIREAVRRAMRILGKQFVLGETIAAALANAKSDMADGYRFSFDMLGEGARTAEDAARYTKRYADAASALSEHAGAPKARTEAVLHTRPGLSVKLSALHPRYVLSQEGRLLGELVPQLRSLARQMRDAWLPLTIDAEEAERLDLSLAMLGPLFTDPHLQGWNGLGLAVQAYSKRTLPLIAWLGRVAKLTGCRIPVRLVKGAYWDSEIKWAQEDGLAGYPVFTRKVNTDVAYLAAAKALLAHPDLFYPQFATHNAHTIAAIAELAGERDYEFQRLHGMGQPVYRAAIAKLKKPCRIYAPVGGHRDLLAYLVRRLLENGANTSFVHRLADDEAPIAQIIADPVTKSDRLPEKANPNIPLPTELFAPLRQNSLGLALWDEATRHPLVAEMNAALAEPATSVPIVCGRDAKTGPSKDIVSPHDRRVLVGVSVDADAQAIDAALDCAREAYEAWDRLGGNARAAILDQAADLFEASRAQLMALLVREAGKTISNAQSELREAVDFLRYYACEAGAKFGAPRVLPGPTGEQNEIARHGRGV
ncbi:MAG: bifunctional proline dehydrogenase/L-glutamate gamma-semialdehyde dehydrogenase PutA, partial [Pseudomonadota bacterium]